MHTCTLEACTSAEQLLSQLGKAVQRSSLPSLGVKEEVKQLMIDHNEYISMLFSSTYNESYINSGPKYKLNFELRIKGMWF